jgi:hypothetical protein
MKARTKKFKKSDFTTKAYQWFLDNPGAKVRSVAERFNISIPYAYKLRDKATGKPSARKELLTQVLKEMDAIAPKTDTVDAILDSRAKDYGAFADNARLAQALKRAMADHADEMGSLFSDEQWEALEMIATKMSRIVNGNPDKIDNWDDIAGYAKLVADKLRGRVR